MTGTSGLFAEWKLRILGLAENTVYSLFSHGSDPATIEPSGSLTFDVLVDSPGECCHDDNGVKYVALPYKLDYTQTYRDNGITDINTSYRSALSATVNIQVHEPVCTQSPTALVVVGAHNTKNVFGSDQERAREFLKCATGELVGKGWRVETLWLPTDNQIEAALVDPCVRGFVFFGHGTNRCPGGAIGLENRPGHAFCPSAFGTNKPHLSRRFCFVNVASCLVGFRSPLEFFNLDPSSHKNQLSSFTGFVLPSTIRDLQCKPGGWGYPRPEECCPASIRTQTLADRSEVDSWIRSAGSQRQAFLSRSPTRSEAALDDTCDLPLYCVRTSDGDCWDGLFRAIDCQTSSDLVQPAAPPVRLEVDSSRVSLDVYYSPDVADSFDTQVHWMSHIDPRFYNFFDEWAFESRAVLVTARSKTPTNPDSVLLAIDPSGLDEQSNLETLSAVWSPLGPQQDFYWGYESSVIPVTMRGDGRLTATLPGSGLAILVSPSSDRGGCCIQPTPEVHDKLDLFQGHRAWPNPSRRDVALEFETTQSAIVSVRVFDVTGGVVRHLAEGSSLGSGVHMFIWDGHTNSGGRAPPGTYFYRIEAASSSLTGKMTLLR